MKHGYKRPSFIAQMVLDRLVGSTVSYQRTTCCGRTFGACVLFCLVTLHIIGACVLFCLVTVHIILFRFTCSWSLK
jgi:hypothetical protein